MGKIILAGMARDFDEVEREFNALDPITPNKKASTKIDPQDIWDRYNKRGKYAEKKSSVGNSARRDDVDEV